MGAIKDPLFGLTLIKAKDMDESLAGTEEGEQELYFNVGFRDFINALIQEKEDVLTTPCEKHFTSLALHDSFFQLSPYLKPKIDEYTGKEIGVERGHRGFGAVLMKSANVLYGPDNALSTAMDEYLAEEINKHTGMSYPEWMEQSNLFQEKMLESLRRNKRMRLEANRQTSKEFEDKSREQKKK